MSNLPELYFILGLRGSGRHAIVADLIEGGIDDQESVLLITAQSEITALPKIKHPNLTTLTWAWEPSSAPAMETGRIVTPELPETNHVFLIGDGSLNPVDQVEAFLHWTQARRWPVTRILTVMHCQLAEQHSAVAAWYDACIHFSDCVLLNRRDGVANAWVGDLQKRFEKACSPCLFELVKKDKVRNPAMILDPEPRRLSLVFDDLDAIDTLDLDEENLPEEPFDLTLATDPYLERLSGGRRAKPIPDLADIPLPG